MTSAVSRHVIARIVVPHRRYPFGVAYWAIGRFDSGASPNKFGQDRNKDRTIDAHRRATSRNRSLKFEQLAKSYILCHDVLMVDYRFNSRHICRPQSTAA
jgi:hypothetical protein